MKQVCIGLLLVLTSACGWHLRGSIDLPSTVNQLYFNAEDAYSPLAVELRDRLSANGIQLTPTPVGAPYALTIVEERQESRVASLGADALANAYEITLQVTYSISRGTGETLAEGLSSSISRTYEADAASAGSNSQEEAIILEEMRSELAVQMLRRLQAEIQAAERDSQTLTPNAVPNDD